MQVIKPTDKKTNVKKHNTSVFLAGSIEMGAAENWQDMIQRLFANIPITIYNPRRDDWDSSWIQRESDPQFNHQVNWELDKLEESDFIFMYFDGKTKSPITLLELGLFADSGKLIVVCPEDFWRLGNVEIVCSRYNIPLFSNKEPAIKLLVQRIKSKLKN